jgi:hypothetical protein
VRRCGHVPIAISLVGPASTADDAPASEGRKGPKTRNSGPILAPGDKLCRSVSVVRVGEKLMISMECEEGDSNPHGC